MNNIQLETIKKNFKKKKWIVIGIRKDPKNTKRKVDRVVLDVICPKGHKTTKTNRSFKERRGCIICLGHNKTIEDLKLAAIEKGKKFNGGICLSKKFYPKKPKYKYKFKCNKHGVFYKTAWEIFKKPSGKQQAPRWCGECGYDISRKYADQSRKNYSDYVSIAKENGGYFCQKKNKFINPTAQKYYKWKCALGHKFTSNYNKVQQGRWCNKCSEGLSERICRAFFEQVFKKKFIKIRPAWLTNENGDHLELDGYNKDLSIAFEHQGIQHRKQHKFWQNKKQFENLKKTDKIKVDLCKLKKIKLVVIHDNEKIFDDRNNLNPFIKKLKQSKVTVPLKVPLRINLSKVMSPNLKKDVDEFVKLYNGAVIQYPSKPLDYVELSCGNKKHENIRNFWSVVNRRYSVCKTCSRFERERKIILETNKELNKYLLSNNHKIIKKYTGSNNYFEIECPNGSQRKLKISTLRKWYSRFKCCYNCKEKITKFTHGIRTS